MNRFLYTGGGDFNANGFGGGGDFNANGFGYGGLMSRVQNEAVSIFGPT